MNERSNKFVLKYVTKKDFDFISKMIEYSNKNHKGELGYPRCDDLTELLSEIELYENTVEESVCSIYHENIPVAVGGYLYTHGENKGYLIGPITIEEYHSKENIKRFIDMILNSKKNIFSKLEVVVSQNNKLLNDSYLELGWNYKITQREMCFDTDTVKDYSSKYIIKEIDKNNVEHIDDVFKLLDKAFKWNGNCENIKELLKEDYKLAGVVDEDNSIIGVVSWSYLRGVDFSRLEYLVVNKDYRGNGIGEALVNYVIKDGIYNKVNRIYLSTDIDNNAANLYKKVGFYDTLVSKIYERRFFNE